MRKTRNDLGFTPPPITLSEKASITRRCKKLVRGFTLVELLVTLSVLSGMMIVSVQKFRSIQQDDSLNAAAQRIVETIRRAQNFAQSGKRTDYSLALAFGVSIEKGNPEQKKAGSLRVFADLNTLTSGIGRWNAAVENPPGVKDIQIGEFISPDISKKYEVVIDTITLGAQSPAFVDIAFLNPDAAGRIDGSANNASVTILLKNLKTERTKRVVYNRISGRVDILN